MAVLEAAISSLALGNTGYKEAGVRWRFGKCLALPCLASKLRFLVALAFVVASQAASKEPTKVSKRFSPAPEKRLGKRERGDGGMSVCNASASI